MAPEVLQKGVAYDSSADWFSLGCMLYKLLRGHSPFRQHKTRDKHQIDKMTMTVDVELPEGLNPELHSLLQGLLKRNVEERLGCGPGGAEEVKQHSFFADLDWQLVFLQKYQPPLVPPRGEVNAADAFDIGSFDEEDTKSIKLTEADHELYKNFNITISERWQQEIAETVFETTNVQCDRDETRRRTRQGTEAMTSDATCPTDCIVDGEVSRLGGNFKQSWEKRHLRLFPNRLELYQKKDGVIVPDKGVELVPMVDIKDILPELQRINKADQCIVIQMKAGNELVLSMSDRILVQQWHEELLQAFRQSTQFLSQMNKKLGRLYGAVDAPSTSDQAPQRSNNASNDSAS